MPVALSIYTPDNKITFFKFDNTTKDHYQILTEKEKEKHSYGEHYVVVTEVIYNDNSSHEISLVISSWGRKFIIDYNEFINNSKEKLEYRFGSAIYTICDVRE